MPGPVGDAGRLLRRLREAVQIRGLRGSVALGLGEIGFAARHGRGFRRRGDRNTQTLVSVAVVRWVLEQVGPGEGRVLLDVGCGRGRVLTVASEHGFARLIGIESDEAMVAAARERLGGRAEIVRGDATTSPVPDDVDVVFLPNPFWPTPATEFLTRLDESLARRPRPVLLAYATPLDHDTVVAHGWRPLATSPDAIVYDR